MAQQIHSSWGLVGNRPNNWNTDLLYLSQSDETWIIPELWLKEFFTTTGIFEAARSGKSIWFMGCGNGRELDVLFREVPTAKAIGIDSALALCQAARANLANGSLSSTPARANQVIFHADMSDRAGMIALKGTHTHNPAEIIVSISCLHLFTMQHQRNVVSMWARDIFVPGPDNRIIFTTLHPTKSIRHGFCGLVNGRTEINLRFTFANQEDRGFMAIAGQVVARGITNLVPSLVAEVTTFPASEAGPHMAPAVRNWMGNDARALVVFAWAKGGKNWRVVPLPTIPNKTRTEVQDWMQDEMALFCQQHGYMGVRLMAVQLEALVILR